MKNKTSIDCEKIKLLYISTEKYFREFTCKQDLQARDPRQDIWFLVQNGTETKTIPHFPDTETRPKHMEK